MNQLIALAVLALGLTLTTVPASAVVYCKTVGVPKGCVNRPVANPGGVGGPASGAGVLPGAGVGTAGPPGAGAANRNGGVNRAGVRR
ncbi:MAG TPA: hypothetical protein DCS21_07865 [Gammaproteobacteria bacterium]|nr:hypothetical protein [Gammaproteobacteria bacterium]